MTRDKHITEKEIIEEIRGITLSGMEGGYAFTSFRENYYEKIHDKEEQSVVLNVLADLLKNEHYDAGFRCKVAWICADIGTQGVKEELEKMLKEPAISTSSYVKIIDSSLKRHRIEMNAREIIEGLKLSEAHDGSAISISFRNKLFDHIADPLEKSDVINILVKFIKSNQYSQIFRIKAAWICADLGVSSIKEELVQMANEPLWREEAYQNYINEIISFINDRKKTKEQINYKKEDEIESKNKIISKKVEYQLTFEEYLEAQRAYVKTSPFAYYSQWVLGILGVIVGIIGIIEVPELVEGYGAILLGAFFILSITLFHRFWIKRIWKKEPRIKEPISVSIAEEELLIISPNEEGKIKWTAFSRLIETKNLFMLFRQRNMFNIVPKRVFGGPDEVDSIRNLLRRKITGSN